MLTHAYELIPKRPYSLSRTAARLAAYPEAVDGFEAGAYRRLFYLGGRAHLLEVTERGAPSRSILQVRITGPHAKEKPARRRAEHILERVLGIRTDLRPFYRRFRNDPILGPFIARLRGLRIAGRASLWETLLQIVLSQQVNLKFAHRMLAGIAHSLGRRARVRGKLYFTFPSPERFAKLSVSELRRLHISRAKSETLIGLAEALRSGRLDEEELSALGDEEFIERLCRFKGVGRWTAEFTALRGLARLDVFPGGDLGVVKYLAQRIFGHDGPVGERKMRDVAERWRPYRGLALIYAYAAMAQQLKAERALRPSATRRGAPRQRG